MLERFIKIEQRHTDTKTGSSTWRPAPGCEHLRMWHMAMTTPSDAEADTRPMTYFHVDFRENIARGMKVVYAGEAFEVCRIADSARLRGLELTCRQISPHGIATAR